ncbi:hypothetical protein ACJMK2_031326 [Sinanodonta woodiana]|uniref:CWF19-like protein 2 n=1 Tax=Sinanodonta woodiana TaxID=1069815 RepID=A0ABD3WYF5_SINWO
MASFIAFESSRVKQNQKEELRQARKRNLEKAENEFHKDHYKKEQARLRGEDTWILPSVDDRIKQEQEELKKAKSKKHKKEKKRKHKKVKRSKSPESDEEISWVEKGQENAQIKDIKIAIKGPRLERESWMEAPMDCIPTITRQEIKERQNKGEKEKQERNILDQPGMHSRELNPYWKEGGTGLPQANKEQIRSVDSKLPRPGDGGISWLKKAYQRCEEKAKEEGRSLEDVAAERWGSLRKLEQMIKESEKGPRGYGDDSRGERSSTNQPAWKKNRFMKPGDADDMDNSKKGRYDERKNIDRSHEGKNRHRRSRSGSLERRSSNRSDSHSRSGSESRPESSRRYQSKRHSSSGSSDSSALRSKSRSPRRNKSRHSRSRSRSRSNSRRSGERQRSISRSSDRLAKQDDKDRDKGRSVIKDIKTERNSLQGRFRRPCDIDSDYVNATEQQSTSARSAEKAPAWKKKESIKTIEDKRLEGKSENIGQSVRKRKSPSSSGSESSSDSSGNEQSESDSEGSVQDQRSPTPEPEVKILSEKEMNELGAKIVKAELMGDDELAQKLKTQIEAARQAKTEYEKTGKSQGRGVEENVVVLTRMDRNGMTRPVSERQHPMEPKKGRRKNRKVETHGNAGERKMYFDDDDRYDLKELVRREKMGTAEDQNLMFARLAGRHMDKADEDFQVDDIFVQRASKQLSESKIEERDRSMAIFEHKKMKGAMDNCHFCFEHVAKHLIVSIGVKVYLCLPNCHSLTEGHCLIVPMQHVSAGTAVDEEVWNEIQTFRKYLTRMFSEHNQDVVFMETSMNLKRFPHMHIECVPMDREVGDLAPIYFKKAIQDAGPEWAHNKKLVDISQKDIRRSVPKGFPYFAVDFGLQGGFAHVIEDEHKFPSYFGREIIGGMIDAEPQLWRKPRKDNFEDQRKKVLQFAEMWKPHDWTQSLKKDTS